MPPILALSLCFIFCIAVYVEDFKKNPDVSPALWIPTLLMMRCGSRTLTSWLNPGGDYINVEGSMHDRIFLSILLILALVVLSRRKIDWKKFFKDNYWILILYAYMFISISWTDSISISFKRWVRAIGDIVIVLVILTDSNQFKAIATVFKRCFILLIPLSVVLIKYFPHYGRAIAKYFEPNPWIGVTLHKSSLGQMVMLAALFFLWHIFQKGNGKKIYLDIIYLIMIAWLLNGGGHSRSSTSILIIVISIVLYFLLEKYKSKPDRLWAFTAGIFVTLLITFVTVDLFFGKSIVDIISVSIGKDPTLTGRTVLWQDLIILGKQHPFFGSGMQGFWTPSIQQYLKEIHSGLHSWGPRVSHNGYIEVFLDLGIVGLIFLGFVIITAFRRIVKQFHLHYEYGRICFILLFAALIHNYTESSFVRPTNLIWFIFLIAAINIYYYPSSLLLPQKKTFDNS